MGQEIAIGALLNFQSWCFNSCSLCPEILIRSCLIFARVFGIFLHFLFLRPKSWMRRIILRVPLNALMSRAHVTGVFHLIYNAKWWTEYL